MWTVDLWSNDSCLESFGIPLLGWLNMLQSGSRFPVLDKARNLQPGWLSRAAEAASVLSSLACQFEKPITEIPGVRFGTCFPIRISHIQTQSGLP